MGLAGLEEARDKAEQPYECDEGRAQNGVENAWMTATAKTTAARISVTEAAEMAMIIEGFRAFSTVLGGDVEGNSGSA